MRAVANETEELQALLDTPGWHIFKQQVLEMYGAEQVMRELNKRAGETQDLGRLGMQTAVVLSVREALNNIFALPEFWIRQAEEERKEAKRQ